MKGIALAVVLVIAGLLWAGVDHMDIWRHINPDTTTAPYSRDAATVTRVVDGDTVELTNGETVRVIGIDTPERGRCGYDEATNHMRGLVYGKQVTLLAPPREDKDRYGRLLRYVQVGNRDAGYDQIRRGLAHARYDSRDGYPKHPREHRYRTTDDKTPNLCDRSN